MIENTAFNFVGESIRHLVIDVEVDASNATIIYLFARALYERFPNLGCPVVGTAHGRDGLEFRHSPGVVMTWYEPNTEPGMLDVYSHDGQLEFYYEYCEHWESGQNAGRIAEIIATSFV